MLRLRQFSRKKPCYFCGAAPPSSAEHVPPQILFGGYNCDRITVPACDDHNNAKSGRDRAIVTAMARSMDQILKAGLLRKPFSSNVQRAIETLEQDYIQANRELTLQQYLIDPPEGLDIVLPFFKSDVQLQTWVVQLTAALVWSIVGEYDPASQWQSAWSWSPHYVPTPEPILFQDAAKLALQRTIAQTEIDQRFTWWSGWSSKPRSYPPDIYHFALCFLSNPEEWDGKEVIFRHQFYDSLHWYVWFETSSNTKAILMDAVRNKNTKQR